MPELTSCEEVDNVDLRSVQNLNSKISDFVLATPWLAKTLWSSHVFIYRKSGGRIGSKIGAISILLLSVRGRKTGQERTVPLFYLKDGDDYVVIASKGGSPHDPVWWLNLKAADEAELQVGSRKLKVKASQASGERREKLWQRAVNTYSGYSDYQKKTDRKIPVVLLSPS